MSAALKVVSAPPGARDALAEAISAREAAQDTLAVAARAVAQAEAGLAAARHAKDAQDASEREAGAGLAARIKKAVQGGQANIKPGATSQSAIARGTVDQNVSEAAAADEVLITEHTAAAQAAQEADKLVKQASRAVLAEHADALIAGGSTGLTIDKAVARAGDQNSNNAAYIYHKRH